MPTQVHTPPVDFISVSHSAQNQYCFVGQLIPPTASRSSLGLDCLWTISRLRFMPISFDAERWQCQTRGPLSMGKIKAQTDVRWECGVGALVHGQENREIVLVIIPVQGWSNIAMQSCCDGRCPNMIQGDELPAPLSPIAPTAHWAGAW